MASPEEIINNDQYLESPKALHLEAPLYREFDLSIKEIEQKIRKIMSYSATIDAYCIWCGKESVFDMQEYYDKGYAISHGFKRVSCRCTRDHNHVYYIYYLRVDNFLLKIGQWPSVADFQIPQAEKYRKIIGGEEYKEFTKGIGLSAHGVGIGSFVYLRRVFENLIEEARTKVQEDGSGFDNEVYLKARMNDKILMVKKYLPEFLVENRNLYSILSKGIHDLTEKECLDYFETMKIGIEQILDEKIIQKDKIEKAIKAKEAIQKIHSNIIGN